MSSSAPLAGVVLLILLLHAAHGGVMAGLSGVDGKRMTSSEGYVPVRTLVYRSAAVTAEAYEPFQLCMGCRCCPVAGNDSSSCVDTQCCYAIDCNIPGKPFGTCGFTPRTCGCGAVTAGNNCTSAPAPPS